MSKSRKFDFNDLSSWGVAPLVLVSVIIIAITLGVTYKLFISNKIDEIDTTINDVNSKKMTTKLNVYKVALLPEMRKQIGELEETLSVAKRVLPTEVSMPALIDDVYNSARNNGIVFSSFTPEKDINVELYTVKPISLSSKVGFVSMSNFIQELTALERIMNIESVSFSRPSGLDDSSPNKSLDMRAELRTYVFNEASDNN